MMIDGLRHFIDIDKLDQRTLRGILDRAAKLKKARGKLPKGFPDAGKPLSGRVLAMIFEKPSTRTRVSFDVAMRQLGGETIVLSAAELQLGRGESVADTARVLSRYVDAIMLRTSKHTMLEDMAAAAGVPVINGLTDDSHPSQVMADVMTYEEKKGPVKGSIWAWSGDGNNLAATMVQAAARFEFELRLACPAALALPKRVLEWAKAEGAKVSLMEDVETAVKGADCVYTDVWVSMGNQPGDRHNLLRPYQVNKRLMDCAKPDAIFMHCLPAHRGEEVTGDVIDGPQSVVFDEAENRLHAQKGILSWCLAE